MFLAPLAASLMLLRTSASMCATPASTITLVGCRVQLTLWRLVLGAGHKGNLTSAAQLSIVQAIHQYSKQKPSVHLLHSKLFIGSCTCDASVLEPAPVIKSTPKQSFHSHPLSPTPLHPGTPSLPTLRPTWCISHSPRLTKPALNKMQYMYQSTHQPSLSHPLHTCLTWHLPPHPVCDTVHVPRIVPHGADPVKAARQP